MKYIKWPPTIFRDRNDSVAVTGGAKKKKKKSCVYYVFLLFGRMYLGFQLGPPEVFIFRCCVIDMAQSHIVA